MNDDEFNWGTPDYDMLARGIVIVNLAIMFGLGMHVFLTAVLR
jgi:hypothetical protein